MDRTERFHIIDQMLNSQGVVTRQQFLDTLEVSPATFKRDLEYLRERLGAPIIWDASERGYRYQSAGSRDAWQLPGLWFNTGEMQALLTMNVWLENLQPGILSDHIKPLQARIRGLLDQGDHSVEEITRRIRILTQARKPTGDSWFELVSQALLSRNRLKISHFNRSTGHTSEREISPQRLTFYRDNWYLDSWCHQRNAIRSFAVDALQQVEVLPKKSIDKPDAELGRELASGYGIFSGAKTRLAELRFSPERARWVAQEQWHPEQQARFDDDGNYYLTIPYSQQPELIMDILKHGAQVEVLSPPSLREAVAETIAQMSQRYQPAHSR
jgi:predicted DNA-binding transcriptional regulator YafY